MMFVEKEELVKKMLMRYDDLQENDTLSDLDELNGGYYDS